MAVKATNTIGGCEMKSINATKWALVTFLLGITTGVLGHYLPIEVSGFIVPMLSGVFAAIGAISQGE